MKQHPVCIGTLERLLFLCLYVQNREEGTSVLICFVLKDETQRVRSLSQSPKSVRSLILVQMEKKWDKHKEGTKGDVSHGREEVRWKPLQVWGNLAVTMVDFTSLCCSWKHAHLRNTNPCVPHYADLIGLAARPH